MSDWSRQIALEDAFYEMHGIKPQVFYLRITRDSYKIKLVHNEQEVELTEVMDKGLTKEVTLNYNGLKKGFSSYHTAEQEAALILRG